MEKYIQAVMDNHGKVYAVVEKQTYRQTFRQGGNEVTRFMLNLPA